MVEMDLDCKALLKAKYCPRVTAVSCTQKKTIFVRND